MGDADHIDESLVSHNVEVITQDGSFFSFPSSDVKLLPIIHST